MLHSIKDEIESRSGTEFFWEIVVPAGIVFMLIVWAFEIFKKRKP
jgi:hypothetical protein